jgi:gas vesicle protein
MRSVLSFIVGAILGSLVGASLALLLAPTSGVNLRLQIQDRTQSFVDEVQTAAQTRRAQLEEQLSQLRAPVRSDDIQIQ